MSARRYTVGRSTGCDIVLSEAWDAASGLHLELRDDGGRYEVVDCNSLNGTEYHDGQAWRPVDRPVAVTRSTRLRLGKEHETSVQALLDRLPSRPVPPPLPAPPPPPPVRGRPWRDEHGRIHHDP
jgi:hypothetical protein